MANANTLKNKKEIVQKIEDKLNSASVIFADFTGLNVEQVTQLRNSLREAGVEYKVVKNTLTWFAAKNKGLTELEPYLKGPTAMAVSSDDIIAPAKCIVDGAKKFDKLRIKAGLVEGKFASEAQIKEIADLPPRPVMIARALGGFKAPITGLVNVLNGNIRGLVVALNAIAEKKA